MRVPGPAGGCTALHQPLGTFFLLLAGTQVSLLFFCERGIFSASDNMFCGVLLPSPVHIYVVQVLKMFVK